MNTKYVLVTPVRDEEKHILGTIQSMANQTLKPQEWIVVDDGSKDGTGAILDEAAQKHPWIRVVHRKDRGFRKAGGGVVDAFYAGYDTIQTADWEFIVKLDGDLIFAPDYFEKCFQYFKQEPKLGISGGVIEHDLSGARTVEENPGFHVRGATKIYRRNCWESIGGLWRAPGWDTIDEVKANMLGWKTYAFVDLHLLHQRFTGTEEGLLRDRIKHGVACYVSGYHPLFVLVKCLSRLPQKPYVLGSAGILWGFVKSYWIRPPRPKDKSYIAYVRLQQLRRLCGMQTIWR
jgi:poly-beta-1,6-N-acetyl-D-glucosamine synthase